MMRIRAAVRSIAWVAAVVSIGAFTLDGTREDDPGTPSGSLLPRLERLGSEDGLSHNSIYAILQDGTGFLWFATQDGLNRYDGRQFLVYKHDPDDASTLSSNLVTALLEDRQGRRWIGTASGLDRLAPDGATFEHVALPTIDDHGADVIPRVNALLESRSGALWVATDHGLVEIDGETGSMRLFRHDENDPASLAADDVRRLQIADDGALWVLTEREERASTLHRFDGTFERFRVPFSFSFYLDGPARVWLDARDPLATAELSTVDSESPVPTPMTAAARDTDGRLWLGSYRGLFLVDGDRSTRLPTTPSGEFGLTDEINAIVIDRAETVWTATFGGLLRHDPNRKPFRHIGQEPGDRLRLSSTAVSSIAQDGRGDIWVGTYGSGLDRITAADDQITRHLVAGDGTDPCANYIWSLAPSRSGRLWIGTRDGLCSLEPDGRLQRHPLPRELASARLLAEGADGTLWVGTEPGLYRYSPTTRTGHLVGGIGIVSEAINALRIAADGSVWYGRAQGDVVRYDPAADSERLYPAVAPEGIWDIRFGTDERVWLATGNGLFALDASTGEADRIEPNDGEIGSVFYSIAEDSQGRLWLGTNDGLVRFDPNASGARFKRYGPSDGVGSVEFNRHAVFQNDAGEMLFGGMNGLTIFRPSDLADNPFVPPVALTAVEILGRNGGRTLQRPAGDGLVLTPDDYAISFEFAALNYTQSQNNRYAYMLEGFDTDWVDAGSDPTVRYTSLPPGDYVFRAKGSNNDGVWNDAGTTLAVTVLPVFWQTWWFRLGVGLVGIGLLTVVYRLRVRRLLQLERMRLRIASDLHDELGSDLSGIALVSSMLGRRDRLSETDRAHLTDISSSAFKIMDGLRDIVWYINPEHDTFDSMQARMRAVAQKLLGDVPHDFHTSLSDVKSNVPMDARRNVFLAYKELLHNIARHAEAGHVDIRLAVHGDLLELDVVDDGVGMSGTSQDGTGLRSIRRRVEDMGGSLRIETPDTGGTSVRITLDMTHSRRGRSQSREARIAE